MRSNSAAIQTTRDAKPVINELFGGLSLAPYAVFLLLSAYAFHIGWLHWETNGGPPYLGGVLAWVIDRLIRWFYRRKYNFVFEIDKPNEERIDQPAIKVILAVVGLVGLLATWYLDSSFHFQIRFMPLWFGVFVCLRGVDWLQNGWIGPGLIHILLGILPIGLSGMPMILGISSDNQYFGVEGIYELSAMGIVVMIVSVMEHLIFLNVRGSNLD